MAEQQLNAPARARHGVPPSPRAGVVHIRHRHTERFTVVGNHLAQHGELSLIAIGLAVYIQSKPDGASVSIKSLTARFPEGEVAVARALHELEAAGYLLRSLERLPDGRRVTRTYAYDRPEHLATQPAPAAPRAEPAPPPAPAPASARAEPEPEPEAKAEPDAGPEPTPAPTPAVAVPEAATVLASLRAHDPRLLLGQRDVARLAPTLTTWLERGVQPDAAVRTLTADLPSGLIRRPAGLLAYRLAEWLPPALPADLPGRAEPPARPHPFQTCDDCDRAFRGPEPGICRDCIEESAEVGESVQAA